MYDFLTKDILFTFICIDLHNKYSIFKKIFFIYNMAVSGKIRTYTINEIIEGNIW